MGSWEDFSGEEEAALLPDNSGVIEKMQAMGMLTERMRKEIEFESWISSMAWFPGVDSRGFISPSFSIHHYRLLGSEYLKGLGDARTAESMKQIPSESFYGLNLTGLESDHDAEIQNPTDKAKFIWEDSVCCTLLHDLAFQPLLAKTYAILFPNLINANLPSCKRWKDVLNATFRHWRNALKKVRSKQSRDPNIVSRGLSLFTRVSKLAVGMIVIGNTPAVGAVRAMAPEAAEPSSLQAGDYEKWNFWFGAVNCLGVLAAIITLLKSFYWRRRHSIAVTSAASAPAGSILNRAVKMAETLTVLRSWREIEYCEVVVSRREEKGAYAL